MKLAKVSLHDYFDEHDDFLSDACNGLRLPQRAIPPKYFYDAIGSDLFDQICSTQEYYPTRTEVGILHQYAAEMADGIGHDCMLVEFGCGSAAKTPLLLNRLGGSLAYVPIDICKPQLEQSASRIAATHAGIELHAICADYTQLQSLPTDLRDDLRRVIFFPGSTIGNYSPTEALGLLKHAAHLAGDNGGLLIGVDCKKDPSILNAAYNDSLGLTAAFNLNLLERMRCELNADIASEGFSHYAFYNPALGRVEMHLVSRQNQAIVVDGERFIFKAGETIHTENSYKYTVEEFQLLARNAGWQAEKHWVDADGYFSIHYLTRQKRLLIKQA